MSDQEKFQAAAPEVQEVPSLSYQQRAELITANRGDYSESERIQGEITSTILKPFLQQLEAGEVTSRRKDENDNPYVAVYTPDDIFSKDGQFDMALAVLKDKGPNSGWEMYIPSAGGLRGSLTELIAPLNPNTGKRMVSRMADQFKAAVIATQLELALRKLEETGTRPELSEASNGFDVDDQPPVEHPAEATPEVEMVEVATNEVGEVVEQAPATEINASIEAPVVEAEPVIAPRSEALHASEVHKTPESAEALRMAAAENLGETATGEVVEDPEVATELDDVEEAVAEVEQSDEERERQLEDAIYAAEHQFRMRESYSAEELSVALGRTLNAFDSDARTLTGVAQMIRGLDVQRMAIDNAINRYTESMDDLNGRINPDYNPRVVLTRELDNIDGQIHSMLSHVSRTFEYGVVDLERSAQHLKSKVGETIHEIDQNEAAVEGHLKEVEGHFGAEQSLDAPKSDQLRSFTESVDTALNEVTGTLDSIDQKYGDLPHEFRKLAGRVKELRESMLRSQGRVDEEALQNVRAQFGAIQEDPRVGDLVADSNKLQAAISTIPRNYIPRG